MNAVKTNIRKLNQHDRWSLEKYPETYMEFSYLEIFTGDKSVRLSGKEEKRKMTNGNLNKSQWLDN